MSEDNKKPMTIHEFNEKHILCDNKIMNKKEAIELSKKYSIELMKRFDKYRDEIAKLTFKIKELESEIKRLKLDNKQLGINTEKAFEQFEQLQDKYNKVYNELIRIYTVVSEPKEPEAIRNLIDIMKPLVTNLIGETDERRNK